MDEEVPFIKTLKDHATITERVHKNVKQKHFLCNFCNKDVRGTSRFAEHLAGQIGDVAICARVPQAVRAAAKEHFKGLREKKKARTSERAVEEEKMATLAPAAQEARMRQTMIQFTSLPVQERAHMQLAMFFYECGIALHLVAHPAFKAMVEAIQKAGQHYKPPVGVLAL
jgi:hypothetical protein